MQRYGENRVTDLQALTVTCSQCRQPPGQPCVYVPVAFQEAGRKARTPAMKATMERVGKPCQRAHNTRRSDYRRKHPVRRVPLPAPLRNAPLNQRWPTRANIDDAAALREAMITENAELANFFAQHGHIFQEAP